MEQRAHLIRKTTEDKYKLLLHDRDNFVNRIIEKFGLVTKTVVDIKFIISRYDKKTNEQLGYFHTEVLKQLVIAYNILGWRCNNKAMAKTLLKEHTGYFEEIINNQTGEVIKVYKSYTKASIKDLSFAIDYAINEVCSEAKVEVKPPRKN